jgi:hypothetical protein
VHHYNTVTGKDLDRISRFIFCRPAVAIEGAE